jgi:hypothetical protein
MTALGAGLRTPPAPAASQPLRPEQLESLWKDLASDDAAKAYQAILALTAAPRESVPFLGKQMPPVPVPDPAKVAQLLKDLQNERFAVREKADKELAKLGDLVEPDLQKAAGEDTPLELRRRVQQLLDKLQGPVTQPEVLRGLRAVEVLENIGTPEAREALRRLGTGAPGSRLTREARSSLERLNRRAAVKP